MKTVTFKKLAVILIAMEGMLFSNTLIALPKYPGKSEEMLMKDGKFLDEYQEKISNEYRTKISNNWQYLFKDIQNSTKLPESESSKLQQAFDDILLDNMKIAVTAWDQAEIGEKCIKMGELAIRDARDTAAMRASMVFMQKFRNLNANEFMEKYLAYSSLKDKIKAKLLEIANVSGGVKKIKFNDLSDKTWATFKEYDCIDLFARQELNYKDGTKECKEIYQRLLCDLEDLDKPAILFEIFFTTEEMYDTRLTKDPYTKSKSVNKSINYNNVSQYSEPPVGQSFIKSEGDFFTFYPVKFDEKTLEYLDKNKKEALLKPFGIFPYSFQVNAATYPYVDSKTGGIIDKTSFFREGLKFKDKIAEWLSIAQKNDVIDFEKLLPNESENGFKFIWRRDRKKGYLTADKYKDRNHDSYAVDAEDFLKWGEFKLSNFNDMLKNASVLSKKITEVPDKDSVDALFK